MGYENLTHEIILEHLRKKLSKNYKQIGINKNGEQKIAYKDHYPDMILGNHGMVLALLEVETEESILEKEVQRWKAFSKLGVKLIIMVPKNLKVKVTELIWNNGLVGKVSIGTYEIAIQMP